MQILKEKGKKRFHSIIVGEEGASSIVFIPKGFNPKKTLDHFVLGHTPMGVPIN